MGMLTLSQAVVRKGRVPDCRILIVEDDPDSRWLLSTILRRLGHDCATAANGAEALQCVATFQPDLILMDLMMPILDGVETTRRLKADSQTKDIPIFVLTGNATPSGEAEAEEAGCDDFLTKPVILSELLSRIEDYFSS